MFDEDQHGGRESVSSMRVGTTLGRQPFMRPPLEWLRTAWVTGASKLGRPLATLAILVALGSSISWAEQQDVGLDLQVSVLSQSRCSYDAVVYEERLHLRMEFRNRRSSPMIVYLKDFREVQLAMRIEDLLAGKPDERLSADHIVSSGFRGARYDIGPAGPGGVEDRSVLETIPRYRAPTAQSALGPGRYFLRIVEVVELPLDLEQTKFQSVRVVSNPVEVIFPASSELMPCA